jgi:hypothetical protein
MDKTKAKIDIQIGFVEDQLKTVDNILEDTWKKIQVYQTRLENGQKGWTKKTLEAKRREYNEILNSRKKLNKELLALEKKRAADTEAQIKKSANSYVSKFKSAFATLTRYFGAYQIINAVVGVFRFLGGELLNVQQNLARVNAITGSTVGEMKELKNTVFSVSAEYGIAASEVSKFSIEMAKLGKTVVETGKIAENAAQLSKILGEDMVTSGTLLVTTLNQYGLSVKEAGRVTSTFFNTIATSPADIKGLQTALQYVGVTARNTGFSIEETGAMIAFLARNGIRMSKIGTGLRNVLSKLSKMGGDVRDTLDELAESGIKVEDAFRMFGIRGGNVANLIIGNWDRVKQIMETEIPAAGDRMLRTAKAMDSYLGTWERFKSGFVAFFGGNETNGAIVNSQKLIEVLDKKGITLRQLSDDYKELAKNRKTALEITQALSKKYGITEGTVGSGGLPKLTEEYTGLSLYVKTSFDEEQQRKQLDNVRKKASSYILNFIKQYKKDHKDIGKLMNQIVTDDSGNSVPFYNMVYLGFQKILGDKEAKKQTDEFFANWQNQMNTVIRDYKTFKQRLVDYKDAKKKFEEIGANLNSNGEILYSKEDYDNAKKRMESILTLLCSLSGGAFEDCKKGRVVNNKFKERIHEILRNYKENVAAALAAWKEEVAGIDKINSASVNGQKRPLSFEQFMVSMGVDTKKTTFKDDEEIIKKYETNTKDFLTKLSLRIHRSAEKQIEAENRRYSKLKAAGDSALKNLLAEKEEAKTQSELTLVLDKISTQKATNIKLEGEHKAAIINTTKEEEVAINKLLELLKKLGIDVDKRIIDSTRIHAEAVKNEVSTIMDAALNIYNKFNQAMLDNTIARLNAEKQATEAKYTEENDILKAQVDNRLITEGQYAKRRRNLEKQKIQEENNVNKAIFDAQKKADIESALIDGVVATAKAAMVEYSTKGLLGTATAPVMAALVAAQTAAEIAAISSRKFYPVKYEAGGWINGNPHSMGGVPISLNGYGGIEAEGNEYIINKRSAAKNAELIEAVNKDENFTDKLIDAISSTKLRAYFTDKDLDAAERNRNFKKNTSNYID